MQKLNIPSFREPVVLHPVTDNFDQMLSVVRRCVDADGISPIALEYDAIPLAETYIKLDDIQTARVIQIDHVVIGYVWLRWWEESNALKSYSHNGRIVPEWRRHGIGMALVTWAEARIRELAALDTGIDSWVIRAHAAASELAANQLLLDTGYTLNTVMIKLALIDLAVPTLVIPMNCTIRSIEPGDYRAVWTANEEAFAGEEGRNIPTELDYRSFTQRLS